MIVIEGADPKVNQRAADLAYKAVHNYFKNIEVVVYGGDFLCDEDYDDLVQEVYESFPNPYYIVNGGWVSSLVKTREAPADGLPGGWLDEAAAEWRVGGVAATLGTRVLILPPNPSTPCWGEETGLNFYNVWERYNTHAKLFGWDIMTNISDEAMYSYFWEVAYSVRLWYSKMEYLYPPIYTGKRFPKKVVIMDKLSEEWKDKIWRPMGRQMLKYGYIHEYANGVGKDIVKLQELGVELIGG